MKVYVVKIKRLDSNTHIVGSLAVIAESKDHAIQIAMSEIYGTTVSSFEEPVEVYSGVVLKNTKSAWEGYH